MTCKDVSKALSEYFECVETDEGSRILTQCLYPSFDPVHVFVSKFGDGYRVHDGGGAARSAWEHGRNDPLINKVIVREAKRFDLHVTDDVLVAKVNSAEWLVSAILAVANGSAAAARAAVERQVSAAEDSLAQRIHIILARTVGEQSVKPKHLIVGRSGKEHKFDFAVERNKQLILIDAVTPHHISVSSKYVAFADTEASDDTRVSKYIVHDRPLEPDDVSLLRQVADIVPVKSLEAGIRRTVQ